MFDPLLPRRRGADFTPQPTRRGPDPALIVLAVLAALGLIALWLGAR